MELSNTINGTLNRYRRKKGYQRLDGATTTGRNTKLARFGGGSGRRRLWKLKTIRNKLRIKFVSPLKLWKRFKNAYMDMMLGLAGNVGYLNGGGNVFGAKRIPKARQVQIGYSYSSNEFENRLVYEIYKAMIASRELGTRLA